MSKIYLAGGLGNQLFQLSFANRLHEDGKEILLDSSYLNDRKVELPLELIPFPLLENNKPKPKLFHSLVHKNLMPHIIFENKPNVLQRLIANYFDLNHFGYYQNLKSNYYFPINLGDYEDKLLKKLHIGQHFKESIAIHIRGSDFLKSTIYHNLESNYYLKVLDNINIMRREEIYIFTDDRIHSKKIIEIISSSYRNVKFKFIPQNFSPLEILMLFSVAETRIISNSTFSWWGGILALSRNRLDTHAPSTFYKKRQMTLCHPNAWTIYDV